MFLLIRAVDLNFVHPPNALRGCVLDDNVFAMPPVALCEYKRPWCLCVFTQCLLVRELHYLFSGFNARHALALGRVACVFRRCECSFDYAFPVCGLRFRLRQVEEGWKARRMHVAVATPCQEDDDITEISCAAPRRSDRYRGNPSQVRGCRCLQSKTDYSRHRVAGTLRHRGRYRRRFVRRDVDVCLRFTRSRFDIFHLGQNADSSPKSRAVYQRYGFRF